MAFTEFTVDTASGSNLNSGAPTGGIYPATSANGAYTQAGGAGGTDRFTAGSGTPFSGVSASDVTAGLVFVSVYADAASAPTTFVGRVTAFTSTTLDISLTAIAGTRPTTAANGRTATVGGAWKGPTLASGFPFGFVTAALTDAAGDIYRVSIKGQANITAAMTHNLVGPGVFQGMTATPNDLGKGTVDGGTSGASYTLLTVSGANIEFWDIIFQNNGASTSADGVTSAAVSNLWSRCTFANLRGSGLVTSTNNQIVDECEAYGCNQSNTAGKYGFAGTGVTYYRRRCISHDNVGGGFLVQVAGGLDHCISESNGGVGVQLSPGAFVTWVNNCDVYNNGGNGISVTPSGTALVFIESCNLVRNGVAAAGYGIQGSGVGVRHGVVRNCSFGSGTQANVSGTTNALGAIQESGSSLYAADVTPWTDPANGDFRISLAAARGAGRGAFTQTQPGYAGTLAFPDVGAAQHRDPTQPGAGDVRLGVSYNDGGTVGTLAVPAAGNVRLGVAVDATAGTAAIPAAGNVRLGIAVDATFGTLAVPAAGDVRFGVAVDAATGTARIPGTGNVRLGTPVDASSGTLAVPLPSQVLVGIATDDVVGTLVPSPVTVATTVAPFTESAPEDFTHPPADVVRELLALLGVASRPQESRPWPAYTPTEPSAPDDCVTVKTTAGQNDGRFMADGSLRQHYGIQVRVRATDERTGWLKANSIRNALAQRVYRTEVTVDSTHYTVHCAAKIGLVLPIGLDNPNTRRAVFTINALVSIQQHE